MAIFKKFPWETTNDNIGVYSTFSASLWFSSNYFEK